MGNLSINKISLLILLVAAVFIPSIIWAMSLSHVSKGTAINGVFSLPSSISENSTISLLVKDTSNPTAQFLTVATNLSAKDFSSWQFNGGKVGVTYQIKAQLVSNGKTSDSNIITVTAPSVNQVLKFSFTPSLSPIPSAATPTQTQNVAPTAKPSPTRVPTPTAALLPTPIVTPTTTPATQSATASISGTLTFTGQPPVNSRVVIFQRVTGTTSFQVAVDNFIPAPLSVWVWQGVPGTNYDFIAILKQKNNGIDTDLATSSTISISAPVTTAALSLSYATALGAPSANMSVNCGSLDGSQNWGATVNFQTVTGAASYWFEIGTTAGGTDLVNSTKNAISGNNQTLSEPFKNGTTYYARYAYAGIPNLLSGASQFSPFSGSVQLKCQ